MRIGGREHRRGQGQGARADGRRTIARDRDRPALRPAQGRRPSDAAPEEPARGDLRGARSGQPRRARPPRRRLAARAKVARHGGARRDLQRLRQPHAAELPGLAARVGDRHLGRLRRATSTTRSGNAAPFFEGGRRRSCAARRAGLALRRLVRNTGRVLDATIARRTGQLRGLIVNGERDVRRARLARRGAGRHVPDPAHVPARDARHGGAAGALRASTPTRWCGTCSQPATDLAPDAAGPGRPRRPTWSTCSTPSGRCGRPRDRRAGGRPLHHGARSRCSRRSTSSSAELNPILAYLAFSRELLAGFLSAGGAALAGNEEGGYTRSTPAATSTTCPSRPSSTPLAPAPASRGRRWERANAYVAPNA